MSYIYSHSQTLTFHAPLPAHTCILTHTHAHIVSQSSVRSQSLSEPTTSHCPRYIVSLCYCLSLTLPPSPSSLLVSLCPSSPRADTVRHDDCHVDLFVQRLPRQVLETKELSLLPPPSTVLYGRLPATIISLFPPPCNPPLPLSFFPPFSVFSPSASSISSLTCLVTGICMPKPSRQSLGFSPPPQSVPKDCTIVTVALLDGPGLPWEPIHSRHWGWLLRLERGAKDLV